MGVRGATELRTRHRWVAGQLRARLGDFRGAADRLESVRQELLARGPLRHAVAVTLDLGMVDCRTRLKPNPRRVRTIVEVCLKRLSRVGEEGRLRQGLHMVLWAVNRDPERALDTLVGMRRAFVVPVPGLVWERMTSASTIRLGSYR